MEECIVFLHQPVHYVFRLIIDCFGVFLAFIAFGCSLRHFSMDQSLRGIILSFTAANVVGSSMLTYNTVATACGGETHNSDYLISITATLSLSHMLLIVLAEHVILNSGFKNRARDYTGFILISWIISLTLGSLKVISIRQDVRVFFLFIDLSVILFLLVKFFTLTRTREKKKRLHRAYTETFLRRRNRTKTKMVGKPWRFKYATIIIFSYIGCTLPWVFNELLEGLSLQNYNPQLYSLSVMVYSLNFYFPSAIFIYLKHHEAKNVVKRTYRYRIRSAYSL